MSFEGEAKERATTMEAIVREIKKAKCDSVVFVGDFNSRLHCESDTQIHPFMFLPIHTGMRKLLNGTFSEAVLHQDELSQVLSQPRIKCLEQRKKKLWDKIVGRTWDVFPLCS